MKLKETFLNALLIVVADATLKAISSEATEGN